MIARGGIKDNRERNRVLKLCLRVEGSPQVGHTLAFHSRQHVDCGATHIAETGPWRVLYHIEGERGVIDACGHMGTIFGKRRGRVGLT